MVDLGLLTSFQRNQVLEAQAHGTPFMHASVS